MKLLKKLWALLSAIKPEEALIGGSAQSKPNQAHKLEERK